MAGFTCKFTPNDKGNPPGKLADAELHFNGGGVLDGLNREAARKLGVSRSTLQRWLGRYERVSIP